MPDAPGISEIINYHAERGRMLHRSLQAVYDHLRNFLVAEEDGAVIGCVAVEVAWAELAEIKSLAVHPDHRGKGIGKQLVDAAVEDARKLGLIWLFALTYEAEFFRKRGFEIVDKDELPAKVWSDCISCPKRYACDEIAMIRQV